MGNPRDNEPLLLEILDRIQEYVEAARIALRPPPASKPVLLTDGVGASITMPADITRVKQYKWDPESEWESGAAHDKLMDWLAKQEPGAYVYYNIEPHPGGFNYPGGYDEKEMEWRIDMLKDCRDVADLKLSMYAYPLHRRISWTLYLTAMTELLPLMQEMDWLFPSCRFRSPQEQESRLMEVQWAAKNHKQVFPLVPIRESKSFGLLDETEFKAWLTRLWDAGCHGWVLHFEDYWLWNRAHGKPDHPDAWKMDIIYNDMVTFDLDDRDNYVQFVADRAWQWMRELRDDLSR